MFEYSPDVYLLVSADCMVLACNDAACTMMDFSKEEVIGQSTEFIFPPAIADSFSHYFQSVISGHRSVPFETRCQAKNGNLYDVRISLTPIKNKARQVAEVLIFVSDLTSQKRAEAASIDREFKLSAIVGYSPSALTLKTPEGRYALANPNFQKIHHLSEEEILGKSDLDLYPEAIASAFIKNDQWVVQTNTRHSIEEIIPIDGQPRIYMSHMFPVHDARGDIKYICRISLDITEKKRAESEVIRLVQTIEQSPMNVIITDEKGLIEFVNDSFVQTTGYLREEAIGKTPRFLSSGKTAPEVYTDLWHKLNHGATWKGEFTNRRKNGEEYFDAAIISPIRQPDGKITSYVSVSEDITDRKHIEKELKRYQLHLEDLVDFRTQELSKAKLSAESANLAKSAFLATMSHEIRTPLNAIIGMAYLLSLSELSEQQRKDLLAITSSSKNLLALINDVLDFSRIEAGELSLEQRPFIFSEVIEDLRTMFTAHAVSKGIQFSIVALPTNLPPVLIGDDNRLRQMLINLIANAIKFTQFGSVTLKVVMLSVNHASKKLRMCFTIQDTGIGISASAMGHLFSPFTQANQSTTRVYGGSGLGLSIVKRISELMGGKIAVESAEGVGSTFRLEVPFVVSDVGALTKSFHHESRMNAQPEYEGRESASALNAIQFNHAHGQRLLGLSILVVDDSELNLSVIQRTLVSEGAIVSVSQSGGSALELLNAKNQSYDLILMDLQMPGLDGCETTSRIRKSLCLVEIPIIALTAGATTTEKERAMNAGMNGFLTKPIEPTSLIQAMIDFVADQPKVMLPSENIPIALKEIKKNPFVADRSESSDWLDIEGIEAEKAQEFMQHDQALYLRVLQLFLKENASLLLKLDHLLQARDYGSVERLIHSLKGQAATLGALQLQKHALELELKFKQIDNHALIGDVEDALTNFKRSFTRLFQAITTSLIPYQKDVF